MTLLSVNQPVVQDSVALKEIWSKIQVDSCPYHYNFHMHTIYSDGQLTPKELIDQAIAIGLKGFAITDHHSLDGFYVAREYFKALQESQPNTIFPHFWTGIEITSDLFGVEVHLLGYAFDPQHWAIKPYLTGERPLGKNARAEQVINAIHQAGGLVVLAHPARYHRPVEELVPKVAQLGIDAIEVYYAYGNPKPWSPSPVESELAKQLTNQYGLLMTCGTDTHGLNLLLRI